MRDWSEAQVLADRCIEAASATHRVDVALIKGRSREPQHVQARWSAMAAMRALGLSTPEIGRALNRDHTTVIHGLRRYSEGVRSASFGGEQSALRARPVLKYVRDASTQEGSV